MIYEECIVTPDVITFYQLSEDFIRYEVMANSILQFLNTSKTVSAGTLKALQDRAVYEQIGTPPLLGKTVSKELVKYYNMGDNPISSLEGPPFTRLKANLSSWNIF